MTEPLTLNVSSRAFDDAASLVSNYSEEWGTAENTVREIIEILAPGTILHVEADPRRLLPQSSAHRPMQCMNLEQFKALYCPKANVPLPRTEDRVYDRPVLEITPEMLDAGVEALANHEHSCLSLAANEAFLAMMKVLNWEVHSSTWQT